MGRSFYETFDDDSGYDRYDIEDYAWMLDVDD